MSFNDYIRHVTRWTCINARCLCAAMIIKPLTIIGMLMFSKSIWYMRCSIKRVNMLPCQVPTCSLRGTPSCWAAGLWTTRGGSATSGPCPWTRPATQQHRARAGSKSGEETTVAAQVRDYCLTYWDHWWLDWLSAFTYEGRGFEAMVTKDFKNGTYCLLVDAPIHVPQIFKPEGKMFFSEAIFECTCNISLIRLHRHILS